MNAQPQNDGARHVSGFARIVTSPINSAAIAHELALFAPPQPRRVKRGPQPGSAPRETPGMRSVGARR